jgi:hypothetical protein
MVKNQVANLALFAVLLVCLSCNNSSHQKITNTPDSMATNPKGSYGYDVEFLKKNTDKVLELANTDGTGKVLLSADYQGRVMTSTASGDSGASFGWLNYSLIGSKEKKKQFNPMGGEERFWLGPEGGQYSIYFKGKDSFSFAKWQVPPFLDTEKYEVSHSDKSSATFTKKANFTNYSGTDFNIDIERKISLLSREELGDKLHLSIPDKLHFVGFETVNIITNTGNNDWTKEKGLLSIWLLGMFTPTAKTVVIIPFNPMANARNYITDNYFGQIPPGRLRVTDSVLYFTCDGKFRSKIGLSPLIAKQVAGSFDFEKNVLTILLPTVNKNGSYVNSKWEIQKDPYKGDVINSYNDGPLADGTQMGPFLEIESSSEALALKKGQAGSYAQTTCHFQGDYAMLKQLAKQVLGVDLDDIRK